MTSNSETKPKGAGKSSFDLIDSKQLLESIDIHFDSIVLDLACGKGAYSLFLAKQNGSAGLVYAVDLWKDGLEILQDKINTAGISNIKAIHADAAGTIPIEDHIIDICLMATVLHDFEEAGQTRNVIAQVKRLLGTGGCLAVIEFKKIEGPPGPPIHIRLSEPETEELLNGYGFKKTDYRDIGPFNYLMTFSI